MRNKRRACAALGLLLLAGCHSHQSASLKTPLSRNALQNASLSGFASPGASLPRYTVTNLGTIPGSGAAGSGATGINDKGQVIGYSGDRAFVWEKGRMRDLGTVKSPSGSDYQIVTSGINNRGQIVGTLSESFSGAYTGERRLAFIWSGGKFHFLNGSKYQPLPGKALSNFTDSEAAAINDRGEVIGTANWTSSNVGPGGPIHAFLYHNKHIRDLGAGTAVGINNKGEVCGYVLTDNRGRPAFSSSFGSVSGQIPVASLWAKNRRLALGRGVPSAINDNRVMIGSAASSFSIIGYGALIGKGGFWGVKDQVILWKQGKLSALNTTGNALGQAEGINNQGYIVGGNWLWSNGVTFDLNRLLPSQSGWTIQVATAINNHDQIVGQGMFQGWRRAFLMTPIK